MTQVLLLFFTLVYWYLIDTGFREDRHEEASRKRVGVLENFPSKINNTTRSMDASNDVPSGEVYQSTDRSDSQLNENHQKIMVVDNIRDLMCTWEYQEMGGEEDVWNQFDFFECLLIEFQYKAYTKTCDDNYKEVTVGGSFKGTIRFDGLNYETGVIYSGANSTI